MRVTFIHNEGFLITVGDKRIMIDVIYEGYPGGILKPVLESQPPFDGVDLVLATHIHHDHFSAELVLSYLQNNPETVFISTQSAVEDILSLDSTVRDRLIPIQIEKGEIERITIKDINLEAIHLSHGIPGLLNLGFIITVDGVSLFHTGDIDPDYVSVAYLQSYGLPAKQIDIAFVIDSLVVFEEYHNHILEGIQARYIIPMHFSVLSPPSGIESVFPNAFIFKDQYGSWVMP